MPNTDFAREGRVQHWKKKSRGFQKGNLSDEQVSELRRLLDLLICWRDSRSDRQGTSTSVRGSCIFSGVYIGKVKAISPRKIKYDSSRRASGRTATSTHPHSPSASTECKYNVGKQWLRNNCLFGPSGRRVVEIAQKGRRGHVTPRSGS